METRKSKLKMSLKKIKRAIISVSDKSHLKNVLTTLKKFNIEIISSGGSFKKIKNMGYDCLEISKYTSFNEMLDGRVKTLHPKIHAGILNIRKNKNHQRELKEKKILNIDLVIVDLYPFEKKLNEKKTFSELIENIDIGGPALIRSAAKNFNDVTVISSILDYQNLIKELKVNRGATSLKFRKLMSSKAFGSTAYYDSIVSNWMNHQLNIKFPENKTISGKLVKKLRYGENPHQEGSLYKMSFNLDIKKIHGKELSYNNYNDIYSALFILNTFPKKEGAVIIKHANPCGVSALKDQLNSYKNALACDPTSAFGGVVAINSIITNRLASELSKTFFEVIIANGFNEGALKILKKKKNVRLINFNKISLEKKEHYTFLGNIFLSQDTDEILLNKKIKIVTIKKPSAKQIESLKFAYNICKFVKSNAIVLVNGQSTIGIGAGQPSRLDSCKIASNKAQEFVPDKLLNSVAASDAFFPFSDGILKLIASGVKAIIQPGGSINDKEIIKAANDAGVTMVFTGKRHFKH
jgi:phosphoribosylaminoimidazolecarboxamide formyltransferase/IMP cyclohydrolase